MYSSTTNDPNADHYYFVLSSLHILCFFLPVSPLLAYVSGTFASLSLLTSVLIIHRHEELDMVGATPANAYLEDIRSKHFGFQGAALAYALPKAFFLYSIVGFFSQWLFIVCQHMCLPRASICIGAVFVVLIAFQYATSHIQLHYPCFPVQWSCSATSIIFPPL